MLTLLIPLENAMQGMCVIKISVEYLLLGRKPNMELHAVSGELVDKIQAVNSPPFQHLYVYACKY